MEVLIRLYHFIVYIVQIISLDSIDSVDCLNSVYRFVILNIRTKYVCDNEFVNYVDINIMYRGNCQQYEKCCSLFIQIYIKHWQKQHIPT